jgi:hypothetical protein
LVCGFACSVQLLVFFVSNSGLSPALYSSKPHDSEGPDSAVFLPPLPFMLIRSSEIFPASDDAASLRPSSGLYIEPVHGLRVESQARTLVKFEDILLTKTFNWEQNAREGKTRSSLLFVLTQWAFRAKCQPCAAFAIQPRGLDNSDTICVNLLLKGKPVLVLNVDTDNGLLFKTLFAKDPEESELYYIPRS